MLTYSTFVLLKLAPQMPQIRLVTERTIPWAHVRFGSKADMCAAKGHVCFTLESGHVHCTSLGLLWANNDRKRCSNQLALI
jgi:hypothetical protein